MIFIIVISSFFRSIVLKLSQENLRCHLIKFAEVLFIIFPEKLIDITSEVLFILSKIMRDCGFRCIFFFFATFVLIVTTAAAWNRCFGSSILTWIYFCDWNTKSWVILFMLLMESSLWIKVLSRVIIRIFWDLYFNFFNFLLYLSNVNCIGKRIFNSIITLFRSDCTILNGRIESRLRCFLRFNFVFRKFRFQIIK